MANWFEKMQEQVNRQNQAALKAEFWRLVEEGVFPDTPETRMAFSQGWFGTIRYTSDKRTLNEAGTGSRAMATMCILFGAIMVGLPTLSYFTFPADKLVVERVVMLIGFGFLVASLGYLLLRKSQKTYGNAVASHREKWGEKSVDE